MQTATEHPAVRTDVMKGVEAAGLTVTNAVWVAAAILHRGNLNRGGFTPEEIVREVITRRLTDGAEDSVRQHVNQHSVANRKPQPNRACMLFDTGDGLRRLFRAGDEVYEGKDPARTHPKWKDLPPAYADLRGWYEEVWMGGAAADVSDPLLALLGHGKELWREEDADQYVNRLRANWAEAS